MNTQVIKNFSWALTGRLSGALFQTAGIVLLARWESVSDFGIVVSVLAFSVLLHAFIDFGFTTFLIKERAIEPHSNKISSCISINTFLANLFGLTSGLVLILLGFLVHTIYFALIPLALWLAYEKRAEQLLGLFIADGNNKKATQLLTQRRFIALATFISLFLCCDLNPTLAYSLGLSIASVLSYYHTYHLLRNEISIDDHYSFRTIFQHTFPFWINSLFAQLRNVDVALVTALSGPLHGAYFGFVNRSLSPLNMLATSMASVILPSVSKEEIKSHHFMKYLWLTTAVSSIPFILLYFLAEPLVPLILGEKYRPAIELLKILCLGLVFFSASSILGSILQGVHLQKNVAFVNIVSTVGYLLVLLPLSYYGNSLYAIFALLLFFVVRFVLMYYYLHRYLGRKNNHDQ